VTRVLVAGAGALGSVFGGFLCRAGYEVTILGRAPHVEAIARDGLHIDGIWGEHHIRGLHCATDPEALAGPFDAILIAVKSFDTAAIAARVEPLLAETGVAISLQNGLGNVEALEACMGAPRVIGARIIFGTILTSPGAARVTVYADPVLVGAWQPDLHPARDAAARYWAAAFAGSGIPSQYTHQLQAALWAKVFYNAALNPLGALLGVHYGALAEDAETRAVMDEVIGEAFGVARAEGVELPWQEAAAYRAVFYDRLVPITFDHRSSMLQDLERGRRTEIEAINGAVWRRGERHSILTPYNETLTRLVRYREQRS